MRKILTSVLSVAGLLAVVLALASSPASAAKVVVTVQTADPGEAGEYTVSWETQGGCDPGSGTSGASGSVSLTVADADGAGDATTGPQQETGVVTDNICNYSWEASFTNAAGADCVIGGTGTTGTTATDLAAVDGTLALVTGACASTGKLAVTVTAPGVNVGDCIAATEDTPDTTDDCDLADPGNQNPDAGDVDDDTTRATADDVTDADSAGAASSTTFTITATPQKDARGNDVEGCNAVSEDTETDYDDNDLQKATLTVVDQALGGASCMYTVSAALPAGFAAGDGSARSTGNSQKDQNPESDNDGPDGVDGNDDDNTVVVPDLTVSIAAAKVFLVQNVIGDAGGAGATYEYKAPCGAPGLPGALTAAPASSGITSVDGRKVVELRTGRFNVSAGLPDGTAEDGVAATALNNKGEACEATLSVSGVPEHCSVSHNSPVSLASADGSVIIEVTVDCSAPEPEPVAPEPEDTGDMGGDDMGGDDMGGDDMGGDDMGGDDMGGDDMGADDMGADDMDDMGPPEDVATG